MLGEASIRENLKVYRTGNERAQGISPLERYASFDYCFNYFQSFWDSGNAYLLSSPTQMQTSCLQLGFYLASWGMLRGSSFLLSKSAKVYERVIDAISIADTDLWTIDAHTYNASNIQKILRFKEILASALPYENGPSDTLTSKIMLGVFGNVPAFDTYFRNGFGVSTFGEKSLRKIADFYSVNRLVVEEHRFKTLDFGSGGPTNRRYTRAKVIDMIFFIEGSK